MEIRKIGRILKSDASTLAERLAKSGADASRLFESKDTFHHRLEPPVCISAPVADIILAILVSIAPGPLGRPAKQSTLIGRALRDFFKVPPREVAKIAERHTGEKRETVRTRLVSRKKKYSSKSRSPKSRSPKPR